MKDWLYQHKWYLLMGITITCAGIYYVYFYDINHTVKPEQVVNSLKTNTNDTKDTKSSKPPEKMMVDVKGQIKHPGVYQAGTGERVIDVITRAGGLTANANENDVNFAEHVQDEMVIYIPAKGEVPEAQAASPVTGSAAPTETGTQDTNSKGTKININKADAAELQNLPGIGPAKAAAIIDYRKKNGPFKTAEDLKEISGIGDKTFEKLKDMVEVH